MRAHLVLGVGVVLESDDDREGASLEATVPDGSDAGLQGMGCRGTLGALDEATVPGDLNADVHGAQK